MFYLFGWKCPNFLFSLEALAKTKYKNGKKIYTLFLGIYHSRQNQNRNRNKYNKKESSKSSLSRQDLT